MPRYTKIPTPQRSPEDVILENHANAIWGYVRANSNSLEAERACKMIRDGFDAAVADTRKLLDDARKANDKLREKNKDLTAKIAELKAAIEQAEEKAAQATHPIEKLPDRVICTECECNASPLYAVIDSRFPEPISDSPENPPGIGNSEPTGVAAALQEVADKWRFPKPGGKLPDTGKWVG